MEASIPKSSEISNIFKLLPTDIVKNILLYDKRYIIRNGKIININKLNNKLYENTYNLLLKKPLIKIYSNVNNSNTFFWSYVTFDKYEIEYNNYHFEENNGNIYYKFKINFSQNKSRKVYETQYKFEIYK